MRVLPLAFFAACATVSVSPDVSRDRFALSAECPAESVDVRAAYNGWQMHGCGKHAFCNEAGYCTFYKTQDEIAREREARLQRSRALFAKTFSCTEADVIVNETPDGTVAEGCDRLAVCMEQTCFARPKPTCGAVAANRFDECNGRAQQMGAQARSRHGWGYYGMAQSIAQGITGTIAEKKNIEACRRAYELELQACTEKHAHR